MRTYTIRSRRPVLVLLVLLTSFASVASTAAAKPSKKSATSFPTVDAAIQKAIQDGQIPGAVLVIGHNGKVVYRKAYGERSLEPARAPMKLDTIFDMASLTKVVATTGSVMRMYEQGLFRLNDPVAKYIPEFGKYGKDEITIRELMTHYSGLPPDLDLKEPWTGKETAYQMANEEELMSPPGAVFRYSDINFIVLGELVERLSKMSLDHYADAHIFQPLGMKSTRFLPPATWLPRIAPTEYDENNHMLHGVVHDPTARRMGGVAGHAGLFSDADDVSKFCQALLDGKFPLSPMTVLKMTTPQQPPTATMLRGLGWDLDSPYSTNRGDLLPLGSFGHTGFTGTSIWIDPTTNTYIVLLTNGVHPHLKPGGAVVSLRTRVATAVAASLKLKPDNKRALAITGYNEAEPGWRRLAARNGDVKTGLENLKATHLSELIRDGTAEKPRRIGVVTNQTGLDNSGTRTIDILAHTPGLQLVAIFSPEHGLTGALDTTDIDNGKDPATGIPVYSVYGVGRKRRPSVDLLKSMDAIVYDIQDAGVRFYSFEVTLGYFLEAAAEAGTEMYVLDRPNPINGAFVQGPVSMPGHESFANYMSVPVRHGMTVGELARMYNGERHIGAKLTVIPMTGWARGDWFDSTGLTWTNPSPNLRSVTEATLYPGVALVEGTNVSVGRGTDTPFEVVGAPWINARDFAAYLNARNLAGLRFVPITFTPMAHSSLAYGPVPYAGKVCQGVNIIVTERNVLDAPELGIELAQALFKMYPQQYKIDKMPELLIDDATFEAI
ncbi:MAG TPA: exo-beta-N-acetylmuramidase NamZ domain-containing protein, partial [Terriglobales bacterium]|nr:exo-beta-N-acetylmuramidase NamZ domain-containing protein [Terriglobales bacterium]